MDVYLSLVICSVLATFASGAPSLKSYYIDPSGISVSGFSSGGSFASQLHLAHSANISGAGIFAAIPYTCYELYGQNVCRYEPASVDVEQLILAAYALAGENYIDSVDNVTDSKVFLFQGTEDDTVFPRSIVNMLAFYNGLGADVSTELRYAGHGFPTKNYGVSCATTEYPYLNNCGYYAAYELLNHIYGNLEVPADDIKLRGTSGEFDQNEFAGRAFSFNEDGGFIYIPSGCTERVDRKYTEDDVCMIEPSEREECGFSGITEDQCTTGRGCCWTQDPPFFCYQPVRTYEECKLHVVFHGCEMGREYLQNEFYQNAGYLEVAEQNNIIVVFPQIDAKIENVNGCWDWWGYEDIDYAVKSGPQISAVWNMIRKLVGDKSYDVDRNGVSVSGISAGGAFAVQMHVAYSAQIMGCGSIATPGPYYCARGSLLGAINTCMNFPIAIDVPTLQEDTAGAEAGGYIDPTSNLRGSKVYVYHGTEDYTVSPGASDKLVEYYNSYSVDLLSELSLEAGHAFPTLSYGNPCDSSYLPFINMCAYDGAFTLLNHIYGNLRRPGSNTQLNGQFMEFDQTEFAGTSWSFDPAGGYIYIPSGCSLSKKQAQRETEEQNNKSQKNEECAVDISDREACGRQGISQNQCLQEGCCWELELPYFCFRKNPEAERCLSVAPGDREECGFSGITEDQCGERNCCWKEELPYFCYNKYSASSTTPAQPATTTNPPSEQCKLHVAFHGCSQGREDIGDVFARNAGYLEVAEENNIIVLFPQIISALGYNPNGCYDWWGYEDEDYAIQTGTQISAVKAMIERIIGYNFYSK